MLIHSAEQLVTVAGGPQRGHNLGKLGAISDGAVLRKGGTIAEVGGSADLLAAYPNEERLDVSGKVVMPGFIDPHTHAVWAGDRAAEFEMRLEGKTYLEILQAGGGIISTVRATREAGLENLMEQTRTRLWQMFYHGSTTVEVKTGYGLETEAELRMLDAILKLDEEGPWSLVPTFLGAHAIAP
jgi:imidazolonepropionase